ncbi:adhesion G protein-coupled receptor E2 [Biomphalaria pfeifferi]|uniref:Adhesion G protein-coupled receptor E2 n=1 Tax=Biomphalaria pfeifferi TaxID=112525 RepID=A0AAD8CA86_BIOPF|nr:adhesion G protein-coupled receptor E2 [Biomphalaria pfeifferi]
MTCRTSVVFQYHFGVATDTNVTVSGHYLPVLLTDIYILASNSFIRDDFETIALEKFFGKESGSTFDYYNIIHEDLSRDCLSNKSSMWPSFKITFENFENIFEASVAQYIPLSWTLKCSYIIFQQSNFTIEWNRTHDLSNVSVTVNFGVTKMIISNMSDLSHLEVTGNELHVCTEVVEKYIQESQRFNEKQTIFIAMSVVTYVCLCASELCLLLTLVTYLRFPELRSVPAKIPAQSLKGRDKSVIVVKLTTLSLTDPAAVVFAVIIAPYITSNTIGYGRRSCYLDSSNLIGR